MDREGLQALLDVLTSRGFGVVGPRVRDEAVVYEPIRNVADLPEGWTDRQDGGRYRLERREDRALFGYAVGPHSWKQFLFPSRQRLWQARRTETGLEFLEEPSRDERWAFLGVRACELCAIAIQDRVFLGGVHRDRSYAERRQRVFVVAVQCAEPSGTCFCVSMQAGPKATCGFDLALTELLHAGSHRFLVEAGSRVGQEVLAAIPHRPANEDERRAAEKVTALAAARMGRTLETRGIRELLQSHPEHPRWEEVASRCLSCGNCTMVCPTCFCSTVEDHSDLSGKHTERMRLWDSCFTLGFSYLHGGSVRKEIRSRYRQWMTHKLSTWFDQFGSSGCVGCGRCITWCPVGIDITEEARAMRSSLPEETAHV
ncbi:4Fe-4S dicluster domain-containing protein [Methylacidimicrobium cyclopophantes]|nr:4Fe-4S dicluster domain-containing protein [Methylacidimicrobium cyclopophantes]